MDEFIKIEGLSVVFDDGTVAADNINLEIKDIEITNDVLKSIASRATEKLDNGRSIIRKSGTEPLIRILIESENKEKSKDIIEFIKEEISKGSK